ncbi:hypothetical protein C8Q75DRAFT_718294 [Abortiporus biennis]|nr:hypothetical protein C8Q75DRAFT_718294 [Abortiporus biennis]
MGNELSRAKAFALGSWIINFSTQTYGMVIKPNMKDIADANHFAFSPNPYFIAAFFSGQTILHVYWMKSLFQIPSESVEEAKGYGSINEFGGGAESEEKMEEKQAIRTTLDYVPIFAVGNLCIAGWLFFWLNNSFSFSQAVVTVNTLIQLYATYMLPPLYPTSHPLLRATHLVVKTFAGIGVLDFIDNGGVALRLKAPPSAILQYLTFILFPIATASSAPIFGSCLVYDLLAMFVGQRFGGSDLSATNGMKGWGMKLGWTALVSAGLVAVKAFRGSRL